VEVLGAQPVGYDQPWLPPILNASRGAQADPAPPTAVAAEKTWEEKEKAQAAKSAQFRADRTIRIKNAFENYKSGTELTPEQMKTFKQSKNNQTKLVQMRRDINNVNNFDSVKEQFDKQFAEENAAKGSARRQRLLLGGWRTGQSGDPLNRPTALRRILGGSGAAADTLSGGGDSDTISGGSGNDRLGMVPAYSMQYKGAPKVTLSGRGRSLAPKPADQINPSEHGGMAFTEQPGIVQAAINSIASAIASLFSSTATIEKLPVENPTAALVGAASAGQASAAMNVIMMGGDQTPPAAPSATTVNNNTIKSQTTNSLSSMNEENRANAAHANRFAAA